MDLVKRIPLQKVAKTVLPLRGDLEVDESFLKSLEAGVVEPIVVRRAGEGGYEVVCGMRRLEGLRRLGKKTALCVVRDLNDKQAAITAMQENIHRKEVAPMDYARSIAEVLIAKLEMSQEEVARLLCVSEPTVSNLLRVYRERALRDKVGAGEISFQVGLELLSAKPKEGDPEQQEEWASFVDKSRGQSVQETRRMIAKSSLRKKTREARCYVCSKTIQVRGAIQVCGECGSKLKVSAQRS
jgi:ParB family chromosome partitioning protein